jgi:ATP-dependent RNA helicase SUPV3L1/SUV3
MLERLADLLRVEDSRGGFEAKADMLSITGMTLEQLADLMQGLGYAAERGERAKVRVEKPAPDATDAPDADAPAADAAATDAEAPAAEAEAPTAVDASADADAQEPEIEVFYTFTWGRKPKPKQNAPRREGAPRGKGKPKGGKNRPDQNKAKSFQARPEKKDKIDPDNPFAAALMGLKKD